MLFKSNTTIKKRQHAKEPVVRLTRLFLILLSLAVITGGCGYTFPHVYDGPTRVIYMPNWQNRTSQLGLDAKIYQSLSRWFQKSDSIVLTKKKAEADLTLAGEIVHIDLPSVSWDGNAQTTEVKVVLQVRYVLKDIKSDKIIWEVPREIWTEAYSTVGGSAAMSDNEREALAQILSDMSERIYIGTLDRLRSSNIDNQK